jgi:PAS domain S-box-containing protein
MSPLDSQRKYRLITEKMADLISILDMNLRVTYVSPASMRLRGFTVDEAMEQSLEQVLTPASLRLGLALFEEEKQQEASGTADPDRTRILEVEVYKKDGSTIWMEINLSFLRDKDGKPVEILVVFRDITNRKRRASELLKEQNLESLGILAGGIAHDFNNLMGIVQGYIEMTLMELPPDHVIRQRLLAAIQKISQTKELTSRLITFSRGGGCLREGIDITNIIRDAVYKCVKGTDVQVAFDFDTDLPRIEVDEDQMKHVFYNLTTNAVEAMPDGGCLSIHVQKVRISAGDVLGLKEGSYLKVDIIDDGSGISEEHLSKIFDPYFTTKRMGTQRGMGLGLSICYSVLKQHGGHISVESRPREGASIALYLPVSIPRPIVGGSQST